MLQQAARIVLAGLLAASVGVLSAQQPTPRKEQARVPRAKHAVAGTLKKVDLGARTLAITTVENAEQALKFDAKTIVRGLAGATQVKALAGKEGAALVVDYAGAGAEATASAVQYLGKESLKLATATVVRIDRRARKIVLKLEAGGEETFQLAPAAPIDLPSGIVALASFAPKPDEKITAVYTEKGKERTIHLIKQVAPSTVSVR